MAKGGVRKKVLTVLNTLGLHARPATLFARTAARFSASITVRKDGLTINGKSILNLMMLAAEEGSALEVSADGDDSVEALDALEALFRDKFGED